MRSRYRGADKSLSRPGRKQANVSGRMAWISFSALPCRGKKTWWQLASRCCWNRARPWHASELVSFLVGLRIYQNPGILRVKIKHNVHPRTGHVRPEGEQTHSFTLSLTSAIGGGGWVVNVTTLPQFTPGRRPGTHCIEGWVGPRAVWTGGKSRPHRDSIPDRPARSSVAIPTELPGREIRFLNSCKQDL